MEIEYPGWMVADMLSLQKYYLIAKQNKDKSEEHMKKFHRIEELYHDFIPENIEEDILKNKGSFETIRKIRKYMQGTWGNICES